MRVSPYKSSGSRYGSLYISGSGKTVEENCKECEDFTLPCYLMANIVVEKKNTW
jgi:hypothetical protein